MPVLTFPVELWAGLVAVGSGNEIAAAGYARQRVLMTYTADGNTLANLNTAQWNIARSDWGDINIVELWDAETGGSKIASLPTEAIVPVPMYAIPRIQAGEVYVARVAGPRPYGRGRYGTGRYGTSHRLVAAGSGIGSPYGVGPYGVGPYAALPRGVPLEVTFDYSGHVCAPGTWAPGPFRWAA